MPEVSLIICTYQRPAEIHRLLSCLREQTVIPNEIIIVDGSLDDKTEIVIKGIPEITGCKIAYIKVPPAERGLTRQRNIGVSHAKGKVIAFLDDDTIPQANYFEEILACFQRHPEAVGVGGLITNEVNWYPAKLENKPTLGVFRVEKWERREDLRWRMRKLLGLDSPLPPGWMPPFGHGRPGIYPPDGNDYQVEFIMGGASAWKKLVFDKINFSTYFEGYGLYEDLDFSIRALNAGKLYVCTRAQLEHHHAPSGRPDQFKYGKMVVRNGWFVWRRRWEDPSVIAKIKWYAIDILLIFLRLIDFRNKGTIEFLGRAWGLLTLFWDKPKDVAGDKKGSAL